MNNNPQFPTPKFYLVGFKNGKPIEFIQENWLTGGYSAVYAKDLKDAKKFFNEQDAYEYAELVGAVIKKLP